jgi:hypothetical protein
VPADVLLDPSAEESGAHEVIVARPALAQAKISDRYVIVRRMPIPS